MLDAHVSQFYEWLPWLDGRFDEVPKDPAARRTWLSKSASAASRPRCAPRSRRLRQGSRRKVEHAEAFEICEYGRRPTPEDIKRLFPFLRNKIARCNGCAGARVLVQGCPVHRCWCTFARAQVHPESACVTGRQRQEGAAFSRAMAGAKAPALRTPLPGASAPLRLCVPVIKNKHSHLARSATRARMRSKAGTLRKRDEGGFHRRMFHPAGPRRGARSSELGETATRRFRRRRETRRDWQNAAR